MYCHIFLLVRAASVPNECTTIASSSELDIVSQLYLFVLKQDMSKVPFNDLKLLKFKPNMFLGYLLKDVGFHLVESLLIQDSVKGFARPLYVMQKPSSK